MTGSQSQGQSPKETVPEKKATLPADVHPESRSRLPLVKREDIDENGQKAYDAIVDPDSRLKAQLIGPAGIWLNCPRISARSTGFFGRDSRWMRSLLN